MWTGPEPAWRRKVTGGMISNPPKLIWSRKPLTQQKEQWLMAIKISYNILGGFFATEPWKYYRVISFMMCTHRGHDGWFEDSQWHFGTFSIVSETFDFHHVEIVFSLSSHTHLQQPHTALSPCHPASTSRCTCHLFCLSWSSWAIALSAQNPQKGPSVCCTN